MIDPPLQGRYAHEHKFFVFQIKQVFEPSENVHKTALYKMVETAYLGCNCGEVIRTRVKAKNGADEL